jgi:hypothetical protein
MKLVLALLLCVGSLPAATWSDLLATPTLGSGSDPTPTCSFSQRFSFTSAQTLGTGTYSSPYQNINLCNTWMVNWFSSSNVTSIGSVEGNGTAGYSPVPLLPPFVGLTFWGDSSGSLNSSQQLPGYTGQILNASPVNVASNGSNYYGGPPVGTAVYNYYAPWLESFISSVQGACSVANPCSVTVTASGWQSQPINPPRNFNGVLNVLPVTQGSLTSSADWTQPYDKISAYIYWDKTVTGGSDCNVTVYTMNQTGSTANYNAIATLSTTPGTNTLYSLPTQEPSPNIVGQYTFYLYSCATYPSGGNVYIQRTYRY